MDDAIFAALRKGGRCAGRRSPARRPGVGIDDAETLHRIDEATVRAEMASAAPRNGGQLPAATSQHAQPEHLAPKRPASDGA